jgi:hypothetical protein
MTLLVFNDYIVASFTAVFLSAAWMAHYHGREKTTLKVIQLWVMDLLEAFLYGVVYGILALGVGSMLGDPLFPPYDASASLERVLCEVLAQAGFNVVLCVVIRDTVRVLFTPFIPDLGNPGERTGTGATGGMILGTLLTCRQGQWKQKLILLDKLITQLTRNQ